MIGGCGCFGIDGSSFGNTSFAAFFWGSFGFVSFFTGAAAFFAAALTRVVPWSRKHKDLHRRVAEACDRAHALAGCSGQCFRTALALTAALPEASGVQPAMLQPGRFDIQIAPRLRLCFAASPRFAFALLLAFAAFRRRLSDLAGAASADWAGG
ncbi:hypothetical protein AK812_SmicGene43564 [Symbiodinium microadriaticum]|uniref:Uncharacterized protein n=1 Tax=Symbiodinium microadriaticum TaxID=2951 RepID=A0A1Q9C0P4_SYMMI|nr:hypothetical protein AK812_SmicGene43564 [Symbiodinium microadriaticum]